MPIEIIGEHPLARKENGNLKNVIGNVFPTENTIITGPGTHGGLLVAYLEHKKEYYERNYSDYAEQKEYKQIIKKLENLK